MTDRGEPDAGDEDEALPELCDLCGAVVADSTEWYAVVPGAWASDRLFSREHQRASRSPNAHRTAERTLPFEGERSHCRLQDLSDGRDDTAMLAFRPKT
ncbi:hypothetical protein ACFYW1_21455 [Streptomyces sp. NPDC002669]|uniref:hypothetical protein n=1 Tax=Streptomyces sp. NPDC002669 TaxID=3364658 RepID=UPI0036B39AC3